MGRGYYGVPGTGPEISDDGDYYYEYEPLITTKDEEQSGEGGINPANIIIFLMALPILPFWAGFAILVHSMRLSALGDRDPERKMQMENELRGFCLLFAIGLLMYLIVLPGCSSFVRHIP